MYKKISLSEDFAYVLNNFSHLGNLHLGYETTHGAIILVKRLMPSARFK